MNDGKEYIYIGCGDEFGNIYLANANLADDNDVGERSFVLNDDERMLCLVFSLYAL